MVGSRKMYIGCNNRRHLETNSLEKDTPPTAINSTLSTLPESVLVCCCRQIGLAYFRSIALTDNQSGMVISSIDRHAKLGVELILIPVDVRHCVCTTSGYCSLTCAQHYIFVFILCISNTFIV